MTEQEKQEQTPELPAPPTEEAPAVAEAAVVREARKPLRKEQAAAPHGPSTAVVLPQRQPGTPIVSRRRMLLVGFWASMGAMAAGIGACSLDLIYPTKVTGFGGQVNVPAAAVPPPGQKVQIPEGRFWLVNLGGPCRRRMRPASRPSGRCRSGCHRWVPTFVWPDPATGALKQGWFRCPCHGSTYTDAGIRVFGPAPRSLDTMAITVSGNGDLTVNTGVRINGAPDNADRAIRI